MIFLLLRFSKTTNARSFKEKFEKDLLTVKQEILSPFVGGSIYERGVFMPMDSYPLRFALKGGIREIVV